MPLNFSTKTGLEVVEYFGYFEYFLRKKLQISVNEIFSEILSLDTEHQKQRGKRN